MCQTTEAGFSGYDAPRAVFLLCPQAPDASHHGRYGPEGMFCVAMQKIADFPQLQFLAGRAVHPVVAQWLCLTVQTLLDQEIPQLLDTVIDVPVVLVVQVPLGAVVEETVELRQLHS